MSLPTRIILGLGALGFLGGTVWWLYPADAGLRHSPLQKTEVGASPSRYDAEETSAVTSPTRHDGPRRAAEARDVDDVAAVDDPARHDEPQPAARRVPPQVKVYTNLEDLDFAVEGSTTGARDPATDFREVAVTIVGPNGYRREVVYPVDREAKFSIVGEDGSALPDGLYQYEAYGRTELMRGEAPAQAPGAAADENGRALGDPRAAERASRPAQETTSGSFRIHEGQIVQPDEEDRGEHRP